jgi:predicted transcriptional regulator
LQLPDSELEVIQVLWTQGACTASDIRETINRQRREPLAHATVATLIQRLETKGYVRKTGEQMGKAFVYRAVLQPERAQQHLVQKYFTRIFGAKPLPVISQLLESSDLSLEDIEELRRMLAEHERRVKEQDHDS